MSLSSWTSRFSGLSDLWSQKTHTHTTLSSFHLSTDVKKPNISYKHRTQHRTASSSGLRCSPGALRSKVTHSLAVTLIWPEKTDGLRDGHEQPSRLGLKLSTTPKQINARSHLVGNTLLSPGTSVPNGSPDGHPHREVYDQQMTSHNRSR